MKDLVLCLYLMFPLQPLIMIYQGILIILHHPVFKFLNLYLSNILDTRICLFIILMHFCKKEI